MLDPTTLETRLKAALARKHPSPGALMPIGEWMTRVIAEIKNPEHRLVRRKKGARHPVAAAR